MSSCCKGSKCKCELTAAGLLHHVGAPDVLGGNRVRARAPPSAHALHQRRSWVTALSSSKAWPAPVAVVCRRRGVCARRCIRTRLARPFRSAATRSPVLLAHEHGVHVCERVSAIAGGQGQRRRWGRCCTAILRTNAAPRRLTARTLALPARTDAPGAALAVTSGYGHAKGWAAASALPRRGALPFRPAAPRLLVRPPDELLEMLTLVLSESQQSHSAAANGCDQLAASCPDQLATRRPQAHERCNAHECYCRSPAHDLGHPRRAHTIQEHVCRAPLQRFSQ